MSAIVLVPFAAQAAPADEQKVPVKANVVIGFTSEEGSAVTMAGSVTAKPF